VGGTRGTLIVVDSPSDKAESGEDGNGARGNGVGDGFVLAELTSSWRSKSNAALGKRGEQWARVDGQVR
jgi:hypothetical protein